LPFEKKVVFPVFGRESRFLFQFRLTSDIDFLECRAWFKSSRPSFMLVFLDEKGKGRSDDKWDDQRYLKVLSRWTGSELKLNSAKVGDSGVLAIIRKVGECGKLAKLELRNDNISSPGFELISNFLISPTSVNLTSLNLFGNDAGEKGAR
jgi:hypothetical protein